jgi:hypothetical protein
MCFEKKKKKNIDTSQKKHVEIVAFISLSQFHHLLLVVYTNTIVFRLFYNSNCIECAVANSCSADTTITAKYIVRLLQKHWPLNDQDLLAECSSAFTDFIRGGLFAFFEWSGVVCVVAAV